MFIVLSFLDVLRVDAYFFENGEKISVFKNIGIRVDRALQNVSTCDKQLLGDTGTDDIFIPRADYFGSCLFLLFTDMTRVYTTKNVCGNPTTNHYGLLPVYCYPLSPLPSGGGGSVWSKIRGEGALRRITKRQTSELPV